jgi:hypothetical protein
LLLGGLPLGGLRLPLGGLGFLLRLHFVGSSLKLHYQRIQAKQQ